MIPSHKLHDQKRRFPIGLDIMDRNDMLMHDSRSSTGFAGESFSGCTASRQKRSQHFDSDRPIEFPVKSFEDHSHAADTEESFDIVATNPAQ